MRLHDTYASWEGGLEVIAMTDASLRHPDLVIRAARLLRTPRGTAPAAQVFCTCPEGQRLRAFVSPDADVARWHEDVMGPLSPVLSKAGAIEIRETPDGILAALEFGWYQLDLRLRALGPIEVFDRSLEDAPVRVAGLESSAGTLEATCDGESWSIPRILRAAWYPAGVIAREAQLVT